MCRFAIVTQPVSERSKCRRSLENSITTGNLRGLKPALTISKLETNTRRWFDVEMILSGSRNHNSG